MNPPYSDGHTGRSDLAPAFTARCLEFSDTVVSVFQQMILYARDRFSARYRSEMFPRLADAEMTSGAQFDGADMMNLIVFRFLKECSPDYTVRFGRYSLRFGDNDEFTLLDGPGEEALSWLSRRHVAARGSFGDLSVSEYDTVKRFRANPTEDNELKLKIMCAIHTRKFFNDGFPPAALVCTYILGTTKWGKAVTRFSGRILTGFGDAEDFLFGMEKRSGYSVLYLGSKKAAENVLSALSRPMFDVLFNCLNLNRSVYNGGFRFIPDIDWESDECLTDAGILRLCGCPPDRSEELAAHFSGNIGGYMDIRAAWRG